MMCGLMLESIVLGYSTPTCFGMGLATKISNLLVVLESVQQPNQVTRIRLRLVCDGSRVSYSLEDHGSPYEPYARARPC